MSNEANRLVSMQLRVKAIMTVRHMYYILYVTYVIYPDKLYRHNYGPSYNMYYSDPYTAPILRTSETQTENHKRNPIRKFHSMSDIRRSRGDVRSNSRLINTFNILKL